MISASIGQEQFICLGYDQRPTGSQQIEGLGAELIPGGRASGIPFSSFDPVQLAIGTKVEMEHVGGTGPRAMAFAREIAADHLAEDPDYYRKLATIHLDGAQLAGFREDFIGALAVVLGQQRATRIMEGFENLVESRAAAGAEEKVKPLVVKGMVISGVAALVGVTALVVAMRRR